MMMKERGFALILAVTMATFLLLSGIVALRTLFSESVMSGAHKRQASALRVAETGLAWAIRQLHTEEAYMSDGKPDFTKILTNAMTFEEHGDDVPCTKALIADRVSCYPPELKDWKRLHSSQISMAEGAGDYRIAVRDDSDEASGSDNLNEDRNGVIYIRSYARDSPRTGARKMLEVTLSRNCE